MENAEMIRQQVIQLQIDVAVIEVKINQLQIELHEKKYTLSKLCELLEIRGITIDDNK